MTIIETEENIANNNIFSFNIPFFAIFLLFIYYLLDIIPILPCKIQHMMYSNLFYRHISCILIILFVVILGESVDKFNFINVLSKTAVIYFLILIIVKTHYAFFIIIFFMIAIANLISYKRNELTTLYHQKNNTDSIKYIKILNLIIKILFVITIILIVIGVIIYYGQKRYEFKNKFNFIKFIFGIENCSFTNNKLSIINSIKYAFIGKI